MTDASDAQLLEQFARNESETAFAELVERYIGLVYSVAFRKTGNPEQSEDITQAVFIVLARKAGSLGAKTILPGWLHHTAQLTAANAHRAEIRRIRREQEAFMQSTLEGTTTATDALWRELSPQLDEAMACLGASDRDALVLRYFQNKSVAEVGTFLGVQENTAQQRVGRALEKLRKFFAKRGVLSTTAIIAGVISANSVQAAPVGLAQIISAAAVAKGAATSTSTLTLVKGTMKIMTWLKVKFALTIGVAALLAGGLATIALSQGGHSTTMAPSQGRQSDISQAGEGKNLTPGEIAQRAMDKYASLTSYSDSGIRSVAQDGKTNIVTTFDEKLERPNFYRIEFETTVFPAVPTRGAVWSAGGGDFRMFGENDFGRKGRTETLPDMKSALQGAPGNGPANVFFNFGGGIKMFLAEGPRTRVERQDDERVGDTDCFVISWTQNNLTTRFWIGKEDFLIHQKQTIFKGPMRMRANNAAIDAEFEREATNMLTQMHQEVTPDAIAAKKAELLRAFTSATDQAQIETHSNIVVNQEFSPSGFYR